MSYSREKLPLEIDIKTAVIKKLSAEGHLSGDAALINEFTVDGWSRRADLVIANGKLHAFEIKSAADSLGRLSGQIKTYQRFFDKVTLVVAPCHEDKALSIAPKSVELWRITENEELFVLRRGRCSEIRNKDALISLLRVRDLRTLLRKSGVSPLPRSRKVMVTTARNFPVSHLRKAVLATIKNRYAATTQTFWKAVGAGPIRQEHLETLSPYLAERRKHEKEVLQLKEQWKTWAETLSSLPDDYHLARWADLMPPEPFGPAPKHIQLQIPFSKDQSSQSSSVS